MIKPTIGLSRRRRLPVCWWLGGTYPLWRYPSLLIKAYRWRLRREGEVYLFRYEGQRIKTSAYYLKTFLGEVELWKRYYLPGFSLKGRTVLDVGAGTGETAAFYFANGAEKVIAVEPSQNALELLRQNAAQNKWNIEIIGEPLTQEHFKRDFDFMKVDCEGCEVQLLELDNLPPSVVEAHSTEVAQRLVQRFGLRLVHSLDRDTFILGR